MIRIFSLVLTLVILIGGLVLLQGYRTNPSYKNSITFTISYSPATVWQELLNIKEAPQRKNDVASVDILEELGNLVAWRENLKNGGYRIYRMNNRDEGKRLVLELTSSSYGLTGIWTFDIRKNGSDSDITISEESILTDIKIRGYRAIMGRQTDLLAWQKYIKVGALQSLLIRP